MRGVPIYGLDPQRRTLPGLQQAVVGGIGAKIAEQLLLRAGQLVERHQVVARVGAEDRAREGGR